MFDKKRVIEYLSQYYNLPLSVNSIKGDASLGNVFRLKIGGGQYILKQHKGSRLVEDIKFESELLACLKESKAPVMSIKRVDNQDFFQINDHFFSIYYEAQGIRKNHATITASELNSFVDTVALMHEATQNYQPKYAKKRRDLFVFDFDEYMMTVMKNEPVNNYLTNDVNKLKDILLSNIERIPIQAIHNDLALLNTYFNQEKVSCIIDFDDCCIGARISDITNALYDLVVIDGRYDNDLCESLVRRFKNREGLSDDEVKLVPLLMFHRIINGMMFFYKYKNDEKGDYYSIMYSRYVDCYLRVRREIV